jgi:K+-transporting ATPase ATPase C chain
MRDLLRAPLATLAFFTVLCGVAYPLAVTGIARIAFPGRAKGSLVIRGDKPVGSALIGQQFADPGHFWGRPSATAPVPYNATSSGGSNLGPLNPKLAENVRARVAALRGGDEAMGSIPVDLVTSSGSGLDPHISPAAAEAQVRRVAEARRLSESAVRRLVARYTEGRQWGLLGEPRVNVLLLNLALDQPLPRKAITWDLSLPNRHTFPSAPPNKLRTYLNLDDILDRGGITRGKPAGKGAGTASHDQVRTH